MTGLSVKATLAPKMGASVSMLRRGLTSGADARGRSKEEKAAIILRLRQREEETKKYGAPLGQAIFLGAAGILALAAGTYGPKSHCHATGRNRIATLPARCALPRCLLVSNERMNGAVNGRPVSGAFLRWSSAARENKCSGLPRRPLNCFSRAALSAPSLIPAARIITERYRSSTNLEP